MQKTYKIATIFTALTALSLIAMQVSDRYNQNETPYGRLLAEKYQKIVALESREGTYSNVELFKEKSKYANSSYNPRPMTLHGLNNTDDKRSELLQMRNNLERAMVGYEMRYAPAEVAGMQASFECRLKNVNINYKLDDKCKRAFEQYYQDAQNITQSQYGQESYNANTENLAPIEEVKLIEEVKQEEALKQVEKTKPVEEVKQVDENIMPIVPVTPAKQQPIINPLITNPKPIISEKDNIMRPVPIKEDKPTIIPVNKDIIQDKNIQKNNDFNPLDYVHPRLRKKLSDTPETLPKPSNKPENIVVPEIEGTINPPPANSDFGIKPISDVKKPVEQLSNNDIIRNSGNVVFLPKAPMIKPNPNFVNMAKNGMDYTATASIPSGEKFVISFEQGGTQLSNRAKSELDLITANIKNGQFSTVKIIGHTDSGGGLTQNKVMSFERASMVHNYLEPALQTAQINQMVLDGIADAKPIMALPKTDARNRRVVIELIK